MNRDFTAYFAAVLAVCLGCYVIGQCTGCFQEAREAVAAGSYEAQQLKCVDDYANKVDIDRCRNKVKLAWSTTDAGADARDGAR